VNPDEVAGGVREAVRLPSLYRIRQEFSSPALADVQTAVRKQLRDFNLGMRVHAGQRVAITAGSRGIRDIAEILRTLADELRRCGARPFVVPAMGSHGGATAEGQLSVLAGLGVTETAVGMPIRSSMETVRVDTASVGDGVPIHFDRFAAEADHIVVVNRIKAHTDFTGPIQSGLLKMMLIGLGKHRGAIEYHAAIRRYGFDRIVAEVATRIAERCHVLCGLAIVENHRHETGLLEVVAPGDFLARERELLKLAERWTPRLPCADLDLLIVDRMGKDVSGSGMDTNIIGRKGWATGDMLEQRPRIGLVYARGLTEASHGNAIGIGMADLAHSRLVQRIDFPTTYANAVTSGTPRGAAIPPHFPSDREALAAAFRILGHPARPRVMRIRSTLELEDLLISEALLAELRNEPGIQVVGEAAAMPFDPEGNLRDF
jgi:Domain of unknown function (DUF362)